MSAKAARPGLQQAAERTQQPHGRGAEAGPQAQGDEQPQAQRDDAGRGEAPIAAIRRKNRCRLRV